MSCKHISDCYVEQRAKGLYISLQSWCHTFSSSIIPFLIPPIKFCNIDKLALRQKEKHCVLFYKGIEIYWQEVVQT